jgi:hypothetical protein
MAYLTFNELSNPTRYFSKAEKLNESLSGLQYKYEKRIFLSYRRKDNEYIDPVVRFLKKLEANIYIDYLDDTLPDIPSPKTAEILRERIKKSDKFILFATPNSNDSNWIPWELGLGDGFLKYENVAILPITNESNYWEEQEYFEIYGYIKEATSKDNKKTEWAIFFPNGISFWLKHWLRN